MLPPSGDQFRLTAGGYDAVVTESGGALRLLHHEGRALLDGFAEDATASAGRGQLLMPWPNRIRDGRYSFAGEDLQLPITEPARQHASHGLARWVAWTVQEHTPRSVVLHYRLMAQTGYPWTLDLQVVYDLSADGLTVTQTATNTGPTPAPYACGAHPYLQVGGGPLDSWELTLPARTRALVDDRLIPVGTEPVAGTPYDFTAPRPIGDLVLDDAFTDLERDETGEATVLLHDPAEGRTVALWVGPEVRWLQLFTGHGTGAARRSLAVEPMTANADAFNSGIDLLVLGPAGSGTDEVSVTWGIRTVEEGA